MSCPSALCRAPALCVLGLDALCVGTQRSLPRAPALFVSGPGALPTLCVAARLSLSQSPALSRSLCRGPALSVSGPGGFCRATRRSLTRVGARRSLRRGPVLSRSPAVSVSGPGARPVVFLLRPEVLIVRARRSLSRAPAKALCVGARLCRGCLCIRARLSVSGTSGLCVGPALCVGGQRSLCLAPCRAGALFCVGAWRSPPRSLRRAPHPRATYGSHGPAWIHTGPDLGSACHL